MTAADVSRVFLAPYDLRAGNRGTVSSSKHKLLWQFLRTPSRSIPQRMSTRQEDIRDHRESRTTRP